MKNARPIKDKASAPGTGAAIVAPKHFLGTDNPRHLRVIQAAITRPLPREQVDQVAGCSNGPQLVSDLRALGLEFPCTRTRKKDRDLFDCFPGVYHLTQLDRRRLAVWLRKRARSRGQS